MTEIRGEKLERIAAELPPTEVVGPEDATLLLVGWGSTFGAIRAGVNNAGRAGYKAAHAHLRYLSPLPPDLGDVLRRYDRVLVPELNTGQLARVLRSEYLVPTIQLNKIQGLPFKASEVSTKIIEILDSKDNA